MNGILASGGMGFVGIILMYVVIIGGFWFLLMRPQKKEQKRIQLMLSELAVGDTVLTTCGFYGVVIDVQEDDVVVEFGNNKNCRIPMQKAAITQVENLQSKGNLISNLKGICNPHIPFFEKKEVTP